MFKYISAFILLFLSVVFLSFNKNNKSNQIETYKGKSISFEELDNFLESSMDDLGIPALSIAIINEGEIAYQNALGVSNTTTKKAVNENSVFEAASLVKPVTAYFALRLSDKGILDIDLPLFYYLPDADMEIDQRYKEITARMVLSHSTGFPNWRWFDSPPEDLDINRGDFFIVKEPNTAFTYSGEAYAYLARVIAHLNFVNMKELGEVFQKEVSDPLEMEHAYVVYDDHLFDNKVRGHIDGKVLKRKYSQGLPHMNSLFFGGLTTEANSYAHFVTALINGEGLYPETHKLMITPRTNIPKDNVSFTEDGITHWGLGLGIKPMENDTIYRHGGSNKGAQSELAFSINKKYGYVFFMNCEKGNEFNEKLEQFLEIGLN